MKPLGIFRVIQTGINYKRMQLLGTLFDISVGSLFLVQDYPTKGSISDSLRTVHNTQFVKHC